jgi:Ni,Fe-hydrogenase I small subunit
MASIESQAVIKDKKGGMLYDMGCKGACNPMCAKLHYVKQDNVKANSFE